MPLDRLAAVLLALTSVVACTSNSDSDDPACTGKCDDTSAGRALVRSALLGEPGARGTGTAVAVSTDAKTALVAALDGNVYVFAKPADTWMLQAKLAAPRANSKFGTAVALSADGNIAVIGAQDEKDTADASGAAYVFTRTGAAWSAPVRLAAQAPKAADNFGNAVAISGDGKTVMVGAQLGDVTLADTGFVDVFALDAAGAWARQAHLSVAQAAARFGAAVALSSDGNVAIIGSSNEDAQTGRARIFVRSEAAWTEQAKLVDAKSLDRFGTAVALSADGTRALVGALNTLDQGAAFVYGNVAGVWTLETKLVPTDATLGAGFGAAVALAANGRTAVVGSTKADVAPDMDVGAAYVFAKPAGEWKQTHRLIAGDGKLDDKFGFSAAVSSDGGEILVGALGARTDRSGVVYVYAPGTDGDADLIGDGTDNCPAVANPNQANHDTDAEGDACDPDDDNDTKLDAMDNCPFAANPEQLDTDSDRLGDACDDDDDADGKLDAMDNCALVANPDQANLDNDALGDACDPDDDQDTRIDTKDNCPRLPNVDQADADNDGIGDVCDPDDDNDGAIDAKDNCPNIPNADQGDADNNGIGNVCDGDLDSDGVREGADNCAKDANPDQSDLDRDGKGDACDDDDDGDAWVDLLDNCASKPNPSQTDDDHDGIGDACDANIDTDDDEPRADDGAAGCSAASGSGNALTAFGLLALFAVRRRRQRTPSSSR